MTNFEDIKNMSKEELADFLDDIDRWCFCCPYAVQVFMKGTRCFSPHTDINKYDFSRNWDDCHQGHLKFLDTEKEVWKKGWKNRTDEKGRAETYYEKYGETLSSLERRKR